MSREQRRNNRTPELIADFPALVARYDQTTPFTQTGQLELHRRTIGIRCEHPTATSALNDRRFADSLYEPLRAWAIDNPRLDRPWVEDRLWPLITGVDIVENRVIDRLRNRTPRHRIRTGSTRLAAPSTIWGKAHDRLRRRHVRLPAQ